MREIDAAAAIATLRAGDPLERVRVASVLDLRALLPAARWWRRQDETIAVPVVIRDCMLQDLDAMSLVFESSIVLQDVVVLGSFALHSTFFNAGLCASRC